MSRTPDEVKADQALEVAIQDVLVASGWADNRLLTEYIVVGAQVGYDGDGDRVSSYFHLLSSGELPYHHIIGLLHTGLEHYTARKEEDD
jgi:hypothetical protein